MRLIPSERRPKNSWWAKSSSSALRALERGPLVWSIELVAATRQKWESGERPEEIARFVQPIAGWGETDEVRLLAGRIRSQAALRGWKRPASYDPFANNRKFNEQKRRALEGAAGRHVQKNDERILAKHPELNDAWAIGPDTEDKIRRLIPSYVPRELREDVVQSVWVSLLEANGDTNLALVVKNAMRELYVYDHAMGEYSKFSDISDIREEK